MEKTVGLGNRMDLVFHNIRLGLFFMDHRKSLEKDTYTTDSLSGQLSTNRHITNMVLVDQNRQITRL